MPYYVRPNPPYFIEQPQSVKFFLGEHMTLSCRINVQNIVSGYNTIEMLWEFNGNTVENPKMLGDVNLHHVESGRLELVFQHLIESNAGRYRCVMRDGLFSIVSEVAVLTLYGKVEYMYYKYKQHVSICYYTVHCILNHLGLWLVSVCMVSRNYFCSWHVCLP